MHLLLKWKLICSAMGLWYSKLLIGQQTSKANIQVCKYYTRFKKIIAKHVLVNLFSVQHGPEQKKECCVLNRIFVVFRTESC